MSGPKISVYSLTGWAGKVVRGQMQCERNALVCAEQIRIMLSEASGRGRELDQSLALLELLQQRDGGQEAAIYGLQSLQSRMDGELREIRREFKRHTPRVSARYTISDEALAKKQRELDRITALRDKLKTLHDEIESAAAAGKEAGRTEQEKTHQTIAEYLSGGGGENPGAPEGRELSKLKASIAEGLGGAVSFEEMALQVEDTSFADRKKAIREELTGLLETDIPKPLQDEIRNAVTSLERMTQMEHLTTFESVTVGKVFRELEACNKERARQQAAREEALIRYRMLCDMAEREAEKERVFADEEELDEAIGVLERVIIHQKEQAYIAECVDEVMTEMGYDLIGRRKVRKKSGRQFRNELYQFGEGTAVNITWSPEGQISMELGGIAREDRLPGDEETAVLTQEMATFCGEFSEFEKRMQEKGVVVGSRIALMPPAAEYAAIINVSDYDVEAGKQITEMNVSAGKKRTAAGKKVLRRGE